MTNKNKNENFNDKLSTIPNDKYKKFFDKFTEIEKLDIEQWKVAHLLGYFCKKYKEVYGVDYHWKFNNPSPAKCFEVWQMNTLSSKLSANPKILKDYIDWAYENLVPKTKRRFTSISFITKDEVLIPYKMDVLLGGKKNLNIDRSSPLPPQYVSILQKHGYKLSSYGDVSFLSQMDPMPPSMTAALEEMQGAGFDLDVLKRII